MAVDWMVQTKLNPPLRRADTIARPRLEERLRQAVLQRPVTLLSAPAGYGKTTLLAALPRLLPEQPVAWVTLDGAENDPVAFLTLLTTALQRLHPSVGESVWPLLAAVPQGGAGEHLRRIVGALLGEVVQWLPEPFALVLDDLHFVTEPAVYVALEWLLEHQPPQMRLVIGTRHDPPLRLARLAARRQLAELRRPDLQFTLEEAVALLNEVMGLALSPTELAALQERTEGWAVGLCLLASSLEGTGSGERSLLLEGVAQTERYVFDFLADEVLQNRPPDMRRFLLQTGILAELTPALCRAATGRPDAGALLEVLYRQNLVIATGSSAAGAEPVYRYHALFAQFLRQQLEQQSPEEWRDVHRRAAQAQTSPVRAVAHYLAAGLWAEAADLIERAAIDLMHRGMAETVQQMVGELPPDVRAARPRLTLLLGRLEIHRGDYAGALPYLSRAQEAFAAAGDTQSEGEVIASLITLAVQDGDSARARSLVDRATMLPLRPQGEASVYMTRAWLMLHARKWEQAAEALQVALAVPGRTQDRPAGLVVATYGSPLLAMLPGCRELLERYCAQAGALAQPDGPLAMGVKEWLACLRFWQGKLDEAFHLAEQAEALRTRILGYPVLGVDLPATLAAIHVVLGHPDEAGRCVQMLLTRLEGAPRLKRPLYLHAAGRVLCQIGRPAEARSLRDRLAHFAGGIELPQTSYLAGHLAGLIALAEGRQKEARLHLAQAAQWEPALPVSAASGSARLVLARLTVDEGRTDEALRLMAPLLEEWQRLELPGLALLEGHLVLPALRLAADRGLPGAARLLPLYGSPPGEQATAEPLTPREQEVLRLLVAGLTNRQIGEQLYIGDETAKTHVVRVLRKLDVPTRTQAALKGKEMGF